MRTMLIIFCMTCFVSCNESKGYVEQEVAEDRWRVLCPSGTCLVTYVWYNDDIVKSWHDDIDTVTDSLVYVRKLQAEQLLKSLP